MLRRTLVVSVLALFVGVGSTQALEVVLFADDFNDGLMDPTLWGGSVGVTTYESGGVMHVDVSATDNGGKLWSTPIELDNATGLITLERDFFIHENFGSSMYLRMNQRFIDETPAPAQGDPGVPVHMRSVYYDYDHYTYPEWGFGWTGPSAFQPVYDTWLHEVVLYDPISGSAQVSINGTPYVTCYGAPMTDDDFLLYYDDTCWYTGHYMLMDNLVVRQAPGQEVPDGGATLALLALGMVPLLLRKR